MTTTLPRTHSTSTTRLKALGTAEWLQFRRNKTLLFMATVFPVGIPWCCSP